MAFPVAEGTTARIAELARARWARLLAFAEAYPLERIGLAAVAAGIVLRLAVPFFMDVNRDGDTYAAMGHAWMLRHEFLMPYGDVTTWGPTPAGYSNHYPPFYPLYLGIVFSLFGFGVWQVKWAAVVMAIAALAVVYVATRDLYGRVAAALVAGIVALEPQLLWVTGAGFSENLVVLTFTLTMWAILRSLQDDRFIVLAGLFAGLAYLSRASVGYFFVVAGLGGFLWRFYYRRWKLFTNVWYMLAILIFVTIAGAWAARNTLLFGWVPQDLSLTLTPRYVDLLLLLPLGLFALASRRVRANARARNTLAAVAGAAVVLWALAGFAPGMGARFTLVDVGARVDVPLWETSSYTRYVQDRAFDEPEKWMHALRGKIPLFVAFLGFYVLAFIPETWKATKRVREEETSALWLSVVLLWVIGWAIAAMFWVFEGGSLYWLIHHRYVVIGVVPIAWLILREARFDRASFRARYALFLVVLFAVCGSTLMNPVKFSDLRAAEHLDPYLREGDEIAVDGNMIKYSFYAYLSHPEQVRIYGWTEGYQPDFIVSLKGTWNWDTRLNECQLYENYTHVGTFHRTYWNGGVMTACLHALPVLVGERGMATGVAALDGRPLTSSDG